MKALVMERYKQFVYKDVPKPEPGEGEVLVRVRACSVCGSDVHGMDGSTGRRRPPIIMGHEAAGEIAQLGPGVTGFQVGDRVTFDSTVYCGQCEKCLAAQVNLCPSRRVLGVSCEDYRMDGAFAEYIKLPAYLLYLIPDNVTYQQAAMVEPLAIAYHAATRAAVTQGASALIVGVGTIGMLLLQVLLALGADNVIVVDLDEKKLSRALELGAKLAINARDEEKLGKILSATKDGAGVDLAYDATGISDTTNLCLQALRLAGKAVLVGNLAPKIDFPLQWVVTRELTLFGSCASAGEYAQSLELISKGKVDVDALISKAVPLSEGAEWLLRIYNQEEGLTKLLLLP